MAARRVACPLACLIAWACQGGAPAVNQPRFDAAVESSPDSSLATSDGADGASPVTDAAPDTEVARIDAPAGADIDMTLGTDLGSDASSDGADAVSSEAGPPSGLRCGFDLVAKYCAAGSLCVRDCVGDAEPTCLVRPADCSAAAPRAVCGCDDRTYANDCLRQQAGTYAAYRGACAVDPDPQSGGITPKGSWGGIGAEIVFGPGGAQFKFNCATGRTDGPAPIPHGHGAVASPVFGAPSFQWAGTYQTNGSADAGAPAMSVVYSGELSDGDGIFSWDGSTSLAGYVPYIELNIVAGTQTIGSFVVTYQSPAAFACPMTAAH